MTQQESAPQELPMDTFRAAELPDPEELVSARRAVLQEAKVPGIAVGLAG